MVGFKSLRFSSTVQVNVLHRHERHRDTVGGPVRAEFVLLEDGLSRDQAESYTVSLITVSLAGGPAAGALLGCDGPQIPVKVLRATIATKGHHRGRVSEGSLFLKCSYLHLLTG